MTESFLHSTFVFLPASVVTREGNLKVNGRVTKQGLQADFLDAERAAAALGLYHESLCQVVYLGQDLDYQLADPERAILQEAMTALCTVDGRLRLLEKRIDQQTP